MAHYLYVLQSITLNHLETRMKVPMDCYNQASAHVTRKKEKKQDFLSSTSSARMNPTELVHVTLSPVKLLLPANLSFSLTFIYVILFICVSNIFFYVGK